MKTVEITIKVGVSEKAKFVAVDHNGQIYEYKTRPIISNVIPVWDIRKSNGHAEPVITIVNWDETLTEVK